MLAALYAFSFFIFGWIYGGNRADDIKNNRDDESLDPGDFDETVAYVRKLMRDKD